MLTEPGTDSLLPTRQSLLSRLRDWQDQDGWQLFFDTYWRLIYRVARQAGFAEVELRYLNAPEERLVEPADPVIAANVSRLNELLFGPLDYAIVART